MTFPGQICWRKKIRYNPPFWRDDKTWGGEIPK